MAVGWAYSRVMDSEQWDGLMAEHGYVGSEGFGI